MSNDNEANIPVLTEIIDPDQDFFDEVATTSERLSRDGVSAEDWQTLEQTLRENVLRQVLARVDFVLEHRVRDSLADVLQTAVEDLAQQIRAGLHHTMEEVVTRAISQEIAKAKSTK